MAAAEYDVSRDGLGALQNARDVGGLRAGDGGRVRSGVLFRSDAPYAGDDAPALSPWPPRHVFDLRSAREVSDTAHPLAGPGVTVLQRPVFADADPVKMTKAAEEDDVSLDSVYGELLRCAGPVIGEIASLLADGDGPVLVHCVAGKDRTGVSVAVLLAAVGVHRDEIVRDYVLTERHIDAIIARIVAGRPEAEREQLLELMTGRHANLMRTPVEAITLVLDTLDAWPGGAAGWLRAQDVSDAGLSRMRRRLVHD